MGENDFFVGSRVRGSILESFMDLRLISDISQTIFYSKNGQKYVKIG